MSVCTTGVICDGVVTEKMQHNTPIASYEQDIRLLAVSREVFKLRYVKRDHRMNCYSWQSDSTADVR